MVSTTWLHATDATLDSELRRFSDSQVDLGQQTTNDGRQLGQYAIDLFSQKSNLFGHLPYVYNSESFIAGSLGRHTQEQPLDDIDVFLVVNGGETVVSTGGVPAPVNTFGSAPNPLVHDARYWQNGVISSTAMLREFLPIAQSCVTPGGQGVFDSAGMGAKGSTLFLKSGRINIDVVLVVLGKSNLLDRYYLPDGAGQWKASNPKEDQRRLSSMNQAQGQNLLSLIRLIKWWNRTENSDRLKGIHIEVMVENALKGWSSTATFSALRLLFPTLRAAVQNPCGDPTGLGQPLDSKLTPQDRALSHSTLSVAATFIERAGQAADLGDVPGARRWLRLVFPI